MKYIKYFLTEIERNEYAIFPDVVPLNLIYPDLCSSIFLVCERGTPTEATVSAHE